MDNKKVTPEEASECVTVCKMCGRSKEETGSGYYSRTAFYCKECYAKLIQKAAKTE